MGYQMRQPVSPSPDYICNVSVNTQKYPECDIVFCYWCISRSVIDSHFNRIICAERTSGVKRQHSVAFLHSTSHTYGGPDEKSWRAESPPPTSHTYTGADDRMEPRRTNHTYVSPGGKSGRAESPLTTRPKSIQGQSHVISVTEIKQ